SERKSRANVRRMAQYRSGLGGVIGVSLPAVPRKSRRRSSMAFPHVNYLAVLVSGIVIFLLGGLWYSVLFKKPWIRLMGIPEEKMKEGSGGAMPLLFLMAFLCGLLTAYIEAIIVNHFPPQTLARGVFVGTLVWVGF